MWKVYGVKVCLAVPWIGLLLQKWLDWTDAGRPLAIASDHPPTFSPVTTFKISHSAVHNHQKQPPFFELNSLLSSTMSSQIHQSYSTKMEAIVSHLVNMPLGPPIPSSLWASFEHDNVALEYVGHFFWELAKEKHKSAESLENAKPEWWLCPLPGCAEAISRWVGKTQDALEATLLIEKNLSQVLLGAWPGFYPCRPPHLWLPGEPLPRWGGKTHQEDGWLPDQPLQAGWSPGWVGQISFQRLTLKHN